MREKERERERDVPRGSLRDAFYFTHTAIQSNGEFSDCKKNPKKIVKSGICQHMMIIGLRVLSRENFHLQLDTFEFTIILINDLASCAICFIAFNAFFIT
jgi:hypothetical protein